MNQTNRLLLSKSEKTEGERVMFRLTTKQITLAGVLGALMIVMQFIGIGFVPVTNLSGGMTLYHIPIIVGAIVAGPIVGLLLGIIFAVCAIIQYGGMFPWFVLIPGRPLVGLFAYYAYASTMKVLSTKKIRYAFITVTALVILGLITIVGVSAFSFDSSVVKGLSDEASQTIGRLQTNGFLFVGAFMLVSLLSGLQLLVNAERVRTSITVAAIVGTLSNTIITVGIAVLTPELLGHGIAERLTNAWIIAGSNGSMEVILAVILCLAIVPPLLDRFGQGQDGLQQN